MQMRELQNRGAIASAQAQMQYEASREANQTALAKTAIQAGLQKDMQMAEYLQGLQEAKQQATDDAARFDQKFTSEQRVTDAKLQSAKKAIQTSPDLTEGQKVEALRRLDVEIATNSTPTQVLGDPNNKPRKDGRQPGDIWTDETTGVIMSVDPDGANRMHTSYDKTREGVKAKLQADQDNEINKSIMEREKIANETAAKKEESREKMKSDFIMGMIKDNTKAEVGKRMSAGQMKEAVKQFMDVMGEDEQRPAKGSQQELIEAAQKSGGTVELTTPAGEKRSYTFKGNSAQAQGISNVQVSESAAWLQNAQRQYGNIQAMPPEIRRQAQMHAQRYKAARTGQ
ncbi:MAG: hypothetical protein WC378_19060 [Opitutaceae bacterium]|jgi:protein-tyrosine-phosphatase